MTRHCEEEHTPGLKRIKTLCDKRSCPRCAAENFKESQWEDPHSYKMVAEAAPVLLQRCSSSSPNDFQQSVKSMEQTGCVPFLMLIAEVFAGG